MANRHYTPGRMTRVLIGSGTFWTLYSLMHLLFNKDEYIWVYIILMALGVTVSIIAFVRYRKRK